MIRLLGVLLVFVAASAQATLIDRGEGFIFDDVLNITWTQAANINGLDHWDGQDIWAAGYSQTHTVYGTFNDWRLPSMDVDNDDTIVNCSSATELACRDNEYGYLYHQYGITPSSPAPFKNVQSYYYWSDTGYALSPLYAWFFHFGFDFQSTDLKGSSYYAWAVRDGDIAPVPVPAAAWLFGTALMGLLGVRHMRR